MNEFYGPFGGAFVAETLIRNLEELKREYAAVREDGTFLAQIDRLLREFVGRPTPITPLERLSGERGGARVYLKREDLTHTGAHKINNALAQALLAKRMGKKRIVAETGAGQHGVAVATACCKLGLECVVYMGAVDAARQAPNVQRMKLLGADLRLVTLGQQTLKDAISEAIRDWIANVDTTHYLLGSAVGPQPFPEIVRDFQSVIGREAREQLLQAEGRLPDAVVACVGGGSNAIGIFSGFLSDPAVRLIGVQAAGEGLESGKHAAPLVQGTLGIIQGSLTYMLQDEHGGIRETHSIAPGLDYPGAGPQHSYLKDSGRVEYTSATDREALEAFRCLCRTEGILPALESAHAVAHALKLAPSMEPGQIVLVNLSGRGDKDLSQAIEALDKLELEGARA
ncbi:tryptophan synthase subunit beta [Paenibacillus pasadenensis]|uniref:Tryptophan synthase beta chain n=1 Tax=Paenibacillus pasadenensis TaxID=217090 RepID=A0A2N5N2X4_9BACL|nr:MULTISPECIES: tryptophan synthase subunit beta [Paenibacillus]PLT44682.1 Tryptophan synthase beta chain [Paenibacillus pasadenensis]QGG55157.1 tryptophan synthase subunit beta [Paenibacillus sp. B01]